MSNLRDVYLHDGSGNPIESSNGALKIYDGDSVDAIVNYQFHQHTAVTSTFAVASTAGETSITLADASLFSVGDYLHLSNGATEGVHPKITIKVGNVLTLDRPLDNAFSIGDTATQSIVNMAVTGSLASPQSFKVAPISGEVWHLTRILIEMTHPTAGDNGLFGGITELTNGVVLRRYDGATSSYKTFTIWRNNSDIVTDMYDVTYAPRSGGGGAYGTNARGTFKQTGTIVYLDGTAGDFIEILIQDDISALTSFRIKAQGHIE